MSLLEDAVHKLTVDLQWRGPNGHPQKYIVVERANARAILSQCREAFQQRLVVWLKACFPAEHIADVPIRVHRFMEEALELAQSLDVPREDIERLIEYVYSRPKGSPSQEVGGVQVTLGAVCNAIGENMDEQREIELDRVWVDIDKIRKKQAAKPPFSRDPLPGQV